MRFKEFILESTYNPLIHIDVKKPESFYNKATIFDWYAEYFVTFCLNSKINKDVKAWRSKNKDDFIGAYLYDWTDAIVNKDKYHPLVKYIVDLEEFTSEMETLKVLPNGIATNQSVDFSSVEELLQLVPGVPNVIEIPDHRTYGLSISKFSELPNFLPEKAGNLNLRGCENLKSLKGIHRQIKKLIAIECTTCPALSSGFVDILKIESLDGKEPVTCDNQKVMEIINKHAKNPNIKDRVQEATFELIDEDLEEYI